jgi:hypothetical protein
MEAAAGILIEPAKELMRSRDPLAIAYPNEENIDRHQVHQLSQTASSSSSLKSHSSISQLSTHTTQGKSAASIKSSSGRMHTTRAMASASGKSFGKVCTLYTKGILVEVPLAVTEGMRAVPRLYGDQVEEHDDIKGFKSGTVVAGKEFIHGFTSGLTDLVMQPYKGGKEEGAWGAMKGLGKGGLGMTTKIASGTLGLIAYPGQGLVRSISKAVKTSTREAVAMAKHQEGEWLLCKSSAEKPLLEVQVLEAFVNTLPIVSRR